MPQLVTCGKFNASQAAQDLAIQTAGSQALSLAGNVLSLTNGGTVTLPDSDAQTLSLSGNVISLTNGGSVTLPALDCADVIDCVTAQPVGPAAVPGTTQVLGSDGLFHLLPVGVTDNDNQTLSISGNQLSIAGGNTVTLPAAAAPTLALSGQTLSIAGGNSVTLPDSDAQALSLAGNVLSLTNGGSVTLPAGAATSITEGTGVDVTGTGTSGDPYVINVASLAANFTYPDSVALNTVGQIETWNATFTNPTTKPIRGLVFSNWNAGRTGNPNPAINLILNLNQRFKVDGAMDPGLSSILWGGVSGGYDVNWSNVNITGQAANFAYGYDDASFGACMKVITIPAGGSVVVEIDVRLTLLGGTYSGDIGFNIQSRNLAFIGVGI